MKLSDYVSSKIFNDNNLLPWQICERANEIIESWIKDLSNDYVSKDGIAIHKTAIVESGAILKPPCIISEQCFIASYAYLRGGVWLDKNVTIGPSTEIKSSFIGDGSKAAHFNFIGDSIIGENVNIEAGAILANYRNEWEQKEIICIDDHQYIYTKHNKFGALIGDNTRIGANSVLAPGTLLKRNSIIQRLSQIDQIPIEMQVENKIKFTT